METLIAIITLAESLYGIPQGLLVSICQVESNLNPYAVVERDGKGGRSSIGMCQLQTRTARHFSTGVSDSQLLNPVINSRLAAAYLRFQFDRYGSWERAVVAYNRGNSTGGPNAYSRKVANAQRLLLSARTSKGLVHQGSVCVGSKRNREAIHLRKRSAMANRSVQVNGCAQEILETNIKSDGGTVNGRTKADYVELDRVNQKRWDVAARSGQFLREDYAYAD